MCLRGIETGVAFARSYVAGFETAITFARSYVAGFETAITFAGEIRVFLVRFLVAVVMVVSTVAVQGRAVVSLFAKSPRVASCV